MASKRADEIGIVQSTISFCALIFNNNFLITVYCRHDETSIIIIWVDDLLTATSNLTSNNNIKEIMKENCIMKDLGKPSYFLGIEYSLNNKSIQMCSKTLKTRISSKIYNIGKNHR